MTRDGLNMEFLEVLRRTEEAGDFVAGGLWIFKQLVAPYLEDAPALLFQSSQVLSIPLDVRRYFATPVFAGDSMAPSRETVPVPEVSVDEDRQLFGGKRDIRLARSSAVVGLKMNASPFEVGKDAFFYPCIPGADARHDLASLLFREHVGHCGRSGLEGDSYVFGDSGDDWDRHRVSDLLV